MRAGSKKVEFEGRTITQRTRSRIRRNRRRLQRAELQAMKGGQRARTSGPTR